MGGAVEESGRGSDTKIRAISQFGDFRSTLLPESPIPHLLSKVVTTYTESAMFDNLVLHDSDQPGQKETCCIQLMKASSQRNLDLMKNMFLVIQPFSQHTI